MIKSLRNQTLKHAQPLLLLALILTAVLPSQAKDFTYQGLKFTTLTDNTCETKQGRYDPPFKYAGNSVGGDIVIPETVYDSDENAYTVTAIGAYSFYQCSNLTSVTIPNTVTSIDGHAFLGCTKLTSVAIPNSVVSIGGSAFWDCSGLKSVTIGNSVSSIGACAFYGCSKLTSVTIPNSVIEIGEAAFDGCTKLSEIIIGNSVATIGSSAFYGCTGLTAVTIPNSVTSIGRQAFYVCTGLTSMYIPTSVTSIGDSAFSGCSNITELTIAETENELAIGSNAFLFAKPVKAYLGRNISSAIFTNNTNLSDLTIGDKVTVINESEFSGCTKLATVNIPTSVTSIGKKAFASCANLTSVNIPSTVTSLESSVFYYCTKLTSLTIPNSVTSIGESAFNGCSALTSVTIPNSVTSIEYCAFQNCTKLANITIDDSEAELTIDSSAFPNVELTTAYIGRNLKYASFKNQTKLSNLTIGEKVSSIKASAFSGCSGITSLKFEEGESVLEIGTNAFSSVKPTEIFYGRQIDFTAVPCTALKTVEFGENITSIADGAFGKATSLRSVTAYSAEPPTIGEATFANATYSEGRLYVKDTAFNDYSTATGWKNFLEIVASDLTTGVSDVAVDNKPGVSVEVGAICVDGDADVRIVSMSGTTVYSGRGEARINVAPGIYIVIIGNTATKVAVK